jgi:preprotein translocase subunit SecD
LGKDSVQRSIRAGIGGLVLVLIFMVAYYRLPGIVADVALVIYALLTYAAFALLGVTLTLPGIAGFILSIGMAVDANVLIFERTREELRSGKTLYRSVEVDSVELGLVF